MKRWMIVLMVLLVAFAATPASADNGRSDHVCFGDSTVVRAGETPNNVVLFGCDARIEKGAAVTRDVVSFGGDVIVEEGATIGHAIVSFGGDVQLAGEVASDIANFGGDVTLDATAVVGNDVIVLGGRVTRHDSATVRGQVLRNTGTAFPRVRVPSFPGLVPLPFTGTTLWRVLGDFATGLVLTLGLAALGALIVVFMPNQLKQVGEVAQQSALPSVGVGCLTWLVVPPLMILFILTCLGIPLSMILGIAFVAAGVFGWIAISMVLGDRLVNALKLKGIVPILAMVIGLLVLWLVTSIPFLGGLIWLFVASLAIGAVALTRFGTRPYPMVAPATPTIAPAQPTPSSPPASMDDSAPSI